MKRKVVKQGPATFMVSLPSKWVKQQGIEKGDEVEVVANGNELKMHVGPSPVEKLKEITITLSHENRVSVRSILGGFYKKGYDLITVNFDNQKIFNIIKESVNHLIGFDITHRKPGSCVIKSYLVETPEEFQNTLNKISHTIKTVQEMTREDYIKGHYERLEELIDYRFSVWKLRDLSLRIINKRKDFKDNAGAYSIVIWTLEKINRNYKRIYKYLDMNHIKMNKEVLVYYDDVTKLVDYMLKSIYRKDVERIEYMHKEHNRLTQKAFNLLEKQKKDAPVVSYLFENVKRVQDILSSLVAVNN
ncbi:hypothetical protein GF345_03670 [Candidatus Woesearchaeota archaeon]|nr:hypothetical protein [Candidatus Woesearchaeota archaeon]